MNIDIRSLLIALFSIAAFDGCFYGDFKGEGKPCPCASGYECDEPRRICVRAGTLMETPDATSTTLEPEDAGVASNPPPIAPDAEPTPADAHTLPKLDGGALSQPDATASVGLDAGQLGLALGADCTMDAQCRSHICLTSNMSGGAQQFCSELCGTSADCPADFACVLFDSVNYCYRSAAFSPLPSLASAGGEACQANDTCHSMMCEAASQCVDRCSRDADCASVGRTCATLQAADGSYVQLCESRGGIGVGGACTVNSECISGICDPRTNTCVRPCCSNAECTPGTTCQFYLIDTTQLEIVKACREAPGSMQNLPLGAPCSMSTQCNSLFCPPSPIPGGPRRCSTTCCKDADCSIFPGGGTCLPLTISTGVKLGICGSY